MKDDSLYIFKRELTDLYLRLILEAWGVRKNV